MSAALTAGDQLRHPDRFFVGGQWITPSTYEMIEVVQPATEEVCLRIAAATEADVDRAVAAARAAFDEGPWPRMTHARRAEAMRALAQAIRARTQAFGHLWTSEVGVLSSISRLFVPGVAEVFDYYAGLAETFDFVERHTPTAGGKVGFLVREPVGVVGAIIPWNGPLPLIAYKLAPALIAGCTVVLKSSPEAPGEAYLLAEIAEEIGLPPGVVNVITADRGPSEQLVRNPGVDKITFTGSTAAGRRIASILGERIGRYTLELGGKSAAVVLDDYDVSAVAASLAASTPVMTGQVCAALTRVVVSRQRHDELVDALVSALSGIVIGDPFDAATGMGPLAMKRQLDRVEGYIAKGQAEGARLASGGGRPAGLDRGFFIEPTVFADVDNSCTIAQEEIFGPVLSVIPADSENQAVEIANDTPYGLNATVFTNDPDRAFAVARRLRSGTVGHNAQRVDFGIAFGGFKQSGVGREGGVEGLLPFLETKTIVLDDDLNQPTGRP
jgi:acyl-CoA reductase-like NAD-dependent aldehyde dehydrogenase